MVVMESPSGALTITITDHDADDHMSGRWRIRLHGERYRDGFGAPDLMSSLLALSLRDDIGVAAEEALGLLPAEEC